MGRSKKNSSAKRFVNIKGEPFILTCDGPFLSKTHLNHKEVIMRSIKTLVLTSLAFLIVGGIMQMAIAGVEPSPFRPEINQLGAVVNSLNSIHDQINRVLGKPPPDDSIPGPDINGVVNRLAAMDNKLYLLDDMVTYYRRRSEGHSTR